MSQQASLKKSVMIGVLLWVLVLSIGVFSLLYVQYKNKPQTISQEKLTEYPKDLPLPSNENAVKELFGVSGKSAKVKTASNKLTSIWFDQSFKIGINKLHVKFFTTQSLDESGQPFECHACNVDVGAITYKQNSKKWEIISKQPQFGVAGSWGEVDDEVKPEIIQFSPTSLAIMLNSLDGNQGYFVEGKKVFVFARNSWHDVGFIITGENNSGTCDETSPPPVEGWLGPCYTYKGTISVVNGSKSEYPDLLVTRTGTEINEFRGAIIPAKNVTYKFKDGEYINPSESQ